MSFCLFCSSHHSITTKSTTCCFEGFSIFPIAWSLRTCLTLSLHCSLLKSIFIHSAMVAGVIKNVFHRIQMPEMKSFNSLQYIVVQYTSKYSVAAFYSQFWEFIVMPVDFCLMKYYSRLASFVSYAQVIDRISTMYFVCMLSI